MYNLQLVFCFLKKRNEMSKGQVLFKHIDLLLDLIKKKDGRHDQEDDHPLN